jgi:hypothetical protein
MDQNSVNQLLERRVNLLRQLADSLRRSQAALLTPDYNEIPVQTKAQQYLCQELRRLARDQPSGSAGSPAAPAEAREKALTGELQRLQAQVADLNRRYAALLRRAQRTVNILCRVLQNSELTYVVPAPSPASGMQDWRR